MAVWRTKKKWKQNLKLLLCFNFIWKKNFLFYNEEGQYNN